MTLAEQLQAVEDKYSADIKRTLKDYTAAETAYNTVVSAYELEKQKVIDVYNAQQEMIRLQAIINGTV